MRVVDKSIVGKRVRFISSTDTYTSLRSGDEGTIDYVDDIGTVFVQWDSGSNLGMVAEAGDRFAFID
jgi:hypothetical protein